MNKDFLILICQCVGYIRHHTFDFEQRKIIFNLVRFLTAEAGLYHVKKVDLFSYPRVLNVMSESSQRVSKPLKCLKQMIEYIPKVVDMGQHDKLIYNKVLVMIEGA